MKDVQKDIVYCRIFIAQLKKIFGNGKTSIKKDIGQFDKHFNNIVKALEDATKM